MTTDERQQRTDSEYRLHELRGEARRFAVVEEVGDSPRPNYFIHTPEQWNARQTAQRKLHQQEDANLWKAGTDQEKSEVNKIL